MDNPDTAHIHSPHGRPHPRTAQPQYGRNTQQEHQTRNESALPAARCRYASDPKSNTEFWQTKFAANVQRDQAAQQALRDLGWKVIIVWECETRDIATLEERLRGELQAPGES